MSIALLLKLPAILLAFDLELVKQITWHEARGEPREAQLLVSCVAWKNRPVIFDLIKKGRYPKTLKKIIKGLEVDPKVFYYKTPIQCPFNFFNHRKRKSTDYCVGEVCFSTLY